MRCLWRRKRRYPNNQNASPDVNRKGKLSKEEVERRRYPKYQNASLDVGYTKEQIKSCFQNFDLNGKGKLSKEEVENAFAQLGSRWPKYRAWRGRIHADADKDGFISLEDELDHLVDYTLKLGYRKK